MKCHREMLGGGSNLWSGHKSEGRLQCNLPHGYGESAVWKKVEKRRERALLCPITDR